MSNTKDIVSINPKYKDRVFRLLFEDKKNILSLYNALNGTSYDDPDDVEITTIEDAIYIKMKNDVSFLIDSYLSLWEQQSSYNPNMPLRGLMYFGNLYSAYVEKNKLNIYGSKLIKIPTPKYVVFYNGTSDREPVTKLKLSDSFIRPDDSEEFEWSATMINLNKGKNPKLLSECKILSDYMVLIEKIRTYQQKGNMIEEAVKKAIDECIENDVLAEFLIKHRAEVLSMCITEFNEKVFVEGIKEEGREEGIRFGMEKGIKALVDSLKELSQPNEIIVKMLKSKFGLTEAEAGRYL